MSSDRANNNRPLKPSLASSRTTRTPLTPRVAGNATPITKSPAVRATPTVRSEPPTPKVRAPATPTNEPVANGNITPRSSARTVRVDSTTTSPSQAPRSPNAVRPKSAVVASKAPTERSGNNGGLAISAGEQSRAQVNRPKSVVVDSSNNMKVPSPLIRSPGLVDMKQSPLDESIDSRFFHASDAPKVEPAPKKPEPPKKAQFFHADGREEERKISLPGAPSPVLSAISEQRSPGPWIRSETAFCTSKSPPMLSPGLSTLSNNSPYFAAATGQSAKRSPSPSKENIHLSYRKGVSQVIGTRPTPRSTTSSTDIHNTMASLERRPSIDQSPPNVARHQKSPSLSSITSAVSQQSRRRSATNVEMEPSPLAHEVKAATLPIVKRSLNDIPSINTSLESPGPMSPRESALSPTKGVSELAAEARRERKVLDLEISNSSLLAINSSLEREVRRQKTELKRFRRLSRSGHFSMMAPERVARSPEDLSSVNEADEDEDGDYFGLASGSVQDDSSDDEESVLSSEQPLSPTARSRRYSDRLAKDEKRLQVDLAKHKELLAQSQAMNQSIKRCMFATDDMIKEGRKALDYHVRVSDVKLGGRVLSNHDDEDGLEIEVQDDLVRDDGPEDQAKGILDMWTGVGGRDGSEGGDRDSGIEADRPPLSYTAKSSNTSDSGQPPGGIPQAVAGASSGFS